MFFRAAPDYYASDAGKKYLELTHNGQDAFIWVAIYDDDTVVKQFPDEILHYLLDTLKHISNEILDKSRLSVSRLDVNRVKEFRLIPTQLALSMLPLEAIRLLVRLDEDEKFIAFWEVDLQTRPPFQKLYRHVVGIQKNVNGASVKFFVVVSPSGSITVSTTTDCSFESE